MLRMNVLPADTYIVINKSILSEQDRKIIGMLYQPIIGAVAASLYLTFWSYLDKNELFSLEWTHHHLVTSMGTKLDELIEAREKLEGIGLLKTYVKKGDVNNFVYEMYAPLTPAAFINNPILGVALYNHVGKKEYEKIVTYFQIPKMNLTGYEDITVLFSDVFDVKAKDSVFTDGTFRDRHMRSLDIISKIDLPSILGLLPEEYLHVQTITKEIKDLIYKLAYIYHFDDDDLLEVIRNSVTEKHTLSAQKLREQSRKLYEFEHNGALPSIIYKNQPAYLRNSSHMVSKRAKIIYTFETTSPYAFLASKYKGGTVPITEMKLLEYLAVDLSLPAGVINVIVDYVLRINNHKLTKNFVIAVASQFKKAGVETVEAAMNLAEKEYKDRNKNKKEKKVVQKPDWFDQKIEKQEALQEEKEEISKLLEEFR